MGNSIIVFRHNPETDPSGPPFAVVQVCVSQSLPRESRELADRVLTSLGFEWFDADTVESPDAIAGATYDIYFTMRDDSAEQRKGEGA